MDTKCLLMDTLANKAGHQAYATSAGSAEPESNHEQTQIEGHHIKNSWQS